MSAQKKKTLIIVCAAVVLVAAMLAVWFAFGPKGTAGQKAIGVTVVYADATTDEFSFSTDAEFLRQDVMTGVDSTPVADGDHFEITLKTGY